MTPPVRVTVLGLGLAGGRIHVPTLQRLPQAKLVALCDPDPVRRAGSWPAPVFAAWQDALEVSADAVVVATTPETHAELTAAAVSLGRHVYVEKPMAATVAEGVALKHAAAAAGIVLQVGFAYRFHPLWRSVRRLLDRGWLEPRMVARAQFTTPGGEGRREPVFDVACHHLDLVSWLTEQRALEVQVSDGGAVGARWPCAAQLLGRYQVGPPTDVVTLSDGRRQVTVDRLRGWRLRGRPSPPVPALVLARLARSGMEVSFTRALAVFLAAVRGGDGVIDGAAGPADGIAAIAIIDALRRSVVTGLPEPVAMV